MQEQESALAVLRHAIQIEIAGQRFYGDASQRCIDPRAKEMLSTLAAEEEGHIRLFLVEHESLRRTGRWMDHQQALSSNIRLDLARLSFDDGPFESIFPDGPADDIVDRRSDDLAALQAGISMEEKAIDMYQRARQAGGDAAARNAYQFLVEEETRHLDQLLGEWQRLAGMSL